MKEAKLVILLLLAAVVRIGFCEDCLPPTTSNMETVIASIITVGDAAASPEITVFNFNIVCRSYARQEGLLRRISAVVQYSCSGHSNCLSGIAEMQVESSCLSGAWSNSVEGITDPSFIISTPDGATLSTTVWENCSLCASPLLAAEVGVTTDSLTHCVGECTN